MTLAWRTGARLGREERGAVGFAPRKDRDQSLLGACLGYGDNGVEVPCFSIKEK